jgi:hypothetical protein
MKLRMYIDLFPGCDLSRFNVMANTSPMTKGENTVRFAFDVVIPDALLHKHVLLVDETAAETTTAQIVGEDE